MAADCRIGGMAVAATPAHNRDDADDQRRGVIRPPKAPWPSAARTANISDNAAGHPIMAARGLRSPGRAIRAIAARPAMP